MSFVADEFGDIQVRRMRRWCRFTVHWMSGTGSESDRGETAGNNDCVGHHAGDGGHLTRRATAIRATGIRTATAGRMGLRATSGPPVGQQLAAGATPPTMMIRELHVRFLFLQFPGAFCGALAAQQRAEAQVLSHACPAAVAANDRRSRIIRHQILQAKFRKAYGKLRDQ